MALLPWSPIARGFLTGKYRRGEPPPEGSRFARGDRRADLHFTDAAFDVLEVVESIAREKGCTPGQFALAWCARQPGITSPIIGPRTMEQLEENLGALQVEVTDADRTRIDAVSPPGRVIVPYYEARFGPHPFRW
ncbi:MAG: aldo/keto reductase [Nitrospinota bacterium]|nr:MAG: aldo/keto reductase [Nitrospinota bacterium]